MKPSQTARSIFDVGIHSMVARGRVRTEISGIICRFEIDRMTFIPIFLMSMDIETLERRARQENLTAREYCLREINFWREKLRQVSDDYRDLDRVEFEELCEKEVDSFIRGEGEKHE